MENKSGKIIAIVALAVAVVALSVGFAAFADTLTIDGNATARAKGNAFDDTNGLNYKTATGKCYLTSDNNKTALAGTNAGNLVSGGGAGIDEWNGISVDLGNDAKDVTCEAVVENKSAYTAYITELSTNAGLSCSSTGSNHTTNETNVCSATTVTVSINDGSHTDTATITNAAATSATKTVEIAPNGEATVTVRINYAGANTDEDTTITIPTISHKYSSSGHTAS